MKDQMRWNLFMNGSRESFEEIYSIYYQNLYSYGMRRINQSNIVRDCIQDLFINLWTNRANLTPTDNIKYYLLASLRNMLIRVSLQDSKWQKVELSEENSFHIQFNPESEYIKKENLTRKAKLLIEGLDKLTSRQKEIIYLRFFEELSYEQIADLLDMSLKGVYKLNYRAIDALKLVLNISKSDLLLLLILIRLELLR